MPASILGDIDLHLIGEGTHRRLWEVLGANVVDPADPDRGVCFAVWAPNARRVCAVGDWNGWSDQADALEPQGSSGVWAGIMPGARVGQTYKFAVTGSDGVTRLKADPMAKRAELPPANASVVAAPPGFDWSDGAWISARDGGGERRPLRVYEVHIGSWRPGLGYRELADPLADHVVGLGFTHVELLPVAEHPFGGSWGYQVSGYYAPTARYGSPDDLRWFVDRMHARGIGVLLDWVPAHFPKDDWSLARFDGTALYEHADPRLGDHPDWGTHVFNYGRHEVCNFLIANALYWLEEFHIDGLRVDAVASMLYLDYSRPAGEWIPNREGGRENLDAIDFIRTLNVVVFGRHPGAMMIAEESTSWPMVTHPVHHGGLGFSHKWNMGWMNDTLAYFSNDPVHRRWHHRSLTFGLLYAFTERFVLPLSHDEVVHGKGSLLGKMAGDDWQRFANLRALFAWMWALPGAKLIFMGSELAPWNEWNAEASLPWHLEEHAPHRGMVELVGTLNEVADDWPALWDQDDAAGGFQWLDADDSDHSVYTFIRWSRTGEAVVCVANFTPVPRPGYRLGLPCGGPWEPVLDTDGARFWGSGYRGVARTVPVDDVAWQGQSHSTVVDLPPLSVVWLGRRAG